MAGPLVKLPLSEGAKGAAALRSANRALGDSNMKEVITPQAGNVQTATAHKWSPACA